MILGVPKETFPGERRVAITPKVIAALKKLGLDILVERSAGVSAGFPDTEYEHAGAKLASRSEVLSQSQILTQVRALGGPAVPAGSGSAASPLPASSTPSQLLIALADPLTRADTIPSIATANTTLFALELLPRITRAQTMDVLSSQATIVGYKSVLLAADALPKLFPMMTTAAGTLAPAKVLVIGAGVAGLQAIATARRLGAVVSGYDVRPAVKEQVESLGARFVVLDLPSGGGAEGTGGYAKSMDAAFYAKQRELLTQVIREQDVIITTAAIPGAKAPILVTADMVRAMAPGSVIVDLAAERGGNCELTKPGETITDHGVTILGPLNLPSTIPNHASQMYAKNVTAFLALLVQKGELKIDPTDEIIKETLVTQNGQIVHPKVREAQGF